MDLNDARQKLRITPAVWYKKCHDVWNSEGIDPYDLLGKEVALKKAA
jgi:ubiquinone biosynthesis protein COQ4